ncbi:MAG: ATP-binding cassette domain-containing protein [Paludibacteraceae bacterium]|nr:ATP-binding cassette domain-containing protein [Paludibacteraceae bacterium]
MAEGKELLINYNRVAVNQMELTVIKNVSLDIYSGELIYLVGRVGSGKSTFLKSVYGECEIVAGDATVMGYNLRKIKDKEMPYLRRQLGIIFQDFKLLTDRNVEANLDFVLRATDNKSESDRKKRIEEVLKYVGMSNKGYKMPHELSGGEQQRIVIARALLNRPKLILADEPTGNLDPDTGKEIMSLLHQISQEGTAVIIATHNMRWPKIFDGRILKFESMLVEEVSSFETSYND